MTKKELSKLRFLSPGPERDRLLEYIHGIQDAVTRECFVYRFEWGLSWEAVAVAVGGGQAGESVRKRVYRHLHNAGRSGCSAVPVGAVPAPVPAAKGRMETVSGDATDAVLSGSPSCCMEVDLP